jgi:hypothetical protein
MKVGDVVGFRGRDYRVGLNRTDLSIELVELKQRSVGLWVSRDEVNELPQGSKQSITQDSWVYVEQSKRTKKAPASLNPLLARAYVIL